VKGLVEEITGQDLLTGEKLAPWERIIGIIPYVSDASKLASKAGDIAKAVEGASDATKAAAANGDAKKALDAADAAKTAEKILEEAGVPLPEGMKQAVDEAIETANAAGTATRTEINDSKFDYLFGRASGNEHNLARTNQNALQMKRLGIPDTSEGYNSLRTHLDATAKDPSSISRTFKNEYGNFEVRESLIAGPSGKFAKVESTWEVKQDGSRRLTTVILFGK
jgi:hypothetical protein